MNNNLTKNQFVEFLAIMRKIDIQYNSNLSLLQKEILKQAVDEMKNMLQQL